MIHSAAQKYARAKLIGALACLSFLSACGGRVLRGEWHTVKQGDTLSAIAQARGVPIEDLIELNQLHDPSRIIAGERLFIPLARALHHRPTGFISLQGEGERRASLSPEDTLPKERLQGHPPLRLLRALQWPLKLDPLTVMSPFGPRGKRAHKGVDLRAPQGSPTLSVLAGRVTRVAFEKKGYGRYVIIDHGDGLESRYAHLHKSAVSEGDEVQAGAEIGEAGNTGLSSGPHLHFELRYQDRPLDPLIYLPAR